MGAFFTNIQVHTTADDKADTMKHLTDAVKEMLLKAGYIEAVDGEEPDRTIAVGTGGPEAWISVYDEAAEEQDTELLDSFAAGLSLALDAETVSILVHDSDVLRMRLFRSGEVVDTYVNEPLYLDEELTKQQVKAFKGQPKLWEHLLSSGAKTSALRQAWNSKEVFAEDILRKAADLLGFDRDRCTLGYNYLQESDLTGITRLAFRLKRIAAEEAAGARPVLRVGVIRRGFLMLDEEWPMGQGKLTEFGIINDGGEAKGLMVVIWGPAYDEGRVNPTQVELIYQNEKKYTRLGKDLKQATGVNGERIMVASYPDYRLPAKKPRDRFQTDSFSISVSGSFDVVGSTILYIGIVVGTEPNRGELAGVIHLNIVPPYRRPLRFEPDKFSGETEYMYLKSINGKRTVFGMVVLNEINEENQEVIVLSLKRWHDFLSSVKEGLYYPEIIEDVRRDTRRCRSQKAKGLLKTRLWVDISQNVSTYAGIKMPLYNLTQKVPGHRGNPFAGIEVSNNLKWAGYGSKEPGDREAPRLTFWLDTDGVDDQLAVLAVSTLIGLIDEILKRTDILQAFIGRRDDYWRYSTQNSYEKLCGIEGHCSEGKLWCCRFLRMTTETIWLGPSLLSFIDLDKIAEICTIETVGDCRRLTLKEGATLDQFEQLLAPILPSRRDWEEAMVRYRGE